MAEQQKKQQTGTNHQKAGSQSSPNKNQGRSPQTSGSKK